MIKPPGYYCSNKFTFLKIDLEKGLSYNCHAAMPRPIDFQWLRENPGQIFNSEINCNERRQMLNGIRNASCEQNCYPAEDRNQVSTRMLESTTDIRYTTVHTTPKTLDITLFSDCNLSCSYCCKEYSSTWYQDLSKNGAYVLPGFDDPDRFAINIKDQIARKISQNQKLHLEHVQLLLNEVELLKQGVEKITITGGEPFLNSHLLDLVDKVKEVPTVALFSGLGVNFNKFCKTIDALSDYPNVTLYISGENIEAFYEFNRYGSGWDDFVKRVEYVRQSPINFVFKSTLSNLSLLGFADFIKFAQDDCIIIEFVNHPVFMNVANLDPTNKLSIIDKLHQYPNLPWLEAVVNSVRSNQNTEQHRTLLRQWLHQFSQRRNINLDFFGRDFLQWLHKTH
jgi:organic radical activating enzyme